MFKMIKTNKYDKLVNDLIYYLYFIFQFAFVISGTAIVRLSQSTYRFSTLFMIVPFALLALCDFYFLLRGMFNKIEIIIYAIVGIVLLLSFYNYRNVMVLANLIVISVFKNTDGKRAIKCYLLATVTAFIMSLILGLIFPNIGNVIQIRGGVERERLGLGFFYASLGQFYYLSIVLAYILYREKIKIYECIVFIVLDFVLFRFTDTRAPFFYVILALVIFLLVDRFKNTILYNVFGFITIVSPLVACIGMTLMSWFYNPDNSVLANINRIVNGRLHLTHNSLMEFGIKLFGQTQPKALGDPKYYLDSSLMVLLILFGLAVTVICVCFMSYFAYISYKTKRLAILLSILIISLRGAFDLGFMAMQFSPVVIFFMPVFFEYHKSCKNQLIFDSNH